MLTEIPLNCLCPCRILPLLLRLLHARSCNLSHLGVGFSLGRDRILGKARWDRLGVIMMLDDLTVLSQSK